jgi:hypothetical protein
MLVPVMQSAPLLLKLDKILTIFIVLMDSVELKPAPKIQIVQRQLITVI